jgi:hypothetical protein
MTTAMNTATRTLLRAALAACCALAASLAAAQDDLPGRVGRIANLSGELYLAPQAQPEAWAPAGLNYPVATGDNLWVGRDGRAEVDLGGSQLRLAGDSNVHVSRLDERQFALFVAQGRTSLRVRVLDPGEVARVDTPNAQVVVTRPGLYRIDVHEDRQRTRVVVREGEANVQTAGALQQVLPGQSAEVEGADPQYASVRNGIGSDGFDTWAADRDRYYRMANNGNHVSPQMVGAADLAQYGTWSEVPDYGAVWYPRDVPADWAPYRDGYWVEVGGWGPTWVDYAPWGYAPFHYGRWAYLGGRWGWFPGAYVARPLWAPALVAWTGGSGWSVSVTVGSPVYGWVPLAWGEPYRPWWGRCSRGCWDRYNRPYSVNVNVWRPESPPPTRYRNFNAPNAVTAVAGTSFYDRRPVQQNMVRVPRDDVAAAPVLASAPPVRAERTRSALERPASAPPPASMVQPTYARPAPSDRGNMTRGVAPPASPAYQPAPPVAIQPLPQQPAMARDDRRGASYAQPQPQLQPQLQPQVRAPQPVVAPPPQGIAPPPSLNRAQPALPAPSQAPQSANRAPPQPVAAPGAPAMSRPAPPPPAAPQAQPRTQEAPVPRGGNENRGRDATSAGPDQAGGSMQRQSR